MWEGRVGSRGDRWGVSGAGAAMGSVALGFEGPEGFGHGIPSAERMSLLLRRRSRRVRVSAQGGR